MLISESLENTMGGEASIEASYRAKVVNGNIRDNYHDDTK
jgi:hypothetical protein